jgi:hypothetical protein
MSNHIEVFSQIKKGVTEDHTPRTFFCDSIEKIIDISATQLHNRIGFRPESMVKAFTLASHPISSEVLSYYDDRNEKFSEKGVKEIRNLTHHKLGEIDREILPIAVREIGITGLDTPALELMQLASFTSFLNFVDQSIPQKSLGVEEYDTKIVNHHFKKEFSGYDPEYLQRLESSLRASLDSTRTMTDKETSVFTVGLMLANFTWLTGQVALVASEYWNVENGINLATKRDFASFDRMIVRNYDHYVAGKKKNHEKARILTAIKLVQDADQYREVITPALMQ